MKKNKIITGVLGGLSIRVKKDFVNEVLYNALVSELQITWNVIKLWKDAYSDFEEHIDVPLSKNQHLTNEMLDKLITGLIDCCHDHEYTREMFEIMFHTSHFKRHS